MWQGRKDYGSECGPSTSWLAETSATGSLAHTRPLPGWMASRKQGKSLGCIICKNRPSTSKMLQPWETALLRNKHGWKPGSTGEQPSARQDASLCRHNWLENARFMWLLVKVEEIKSSPGKQLTHRLAMDTSVPSWRVLSEFNILKLHTPTFLDRIVLS